MKITLFANAAALLGMPVIRVAGAKRQTRLRRWHAAFAAALIFSELLIPSFSAVAASIPLDAAESFAVLAGSTVVNTGPTTIFGDLGASPGTAITGFPPGSISGGTIHSADALAAQAHSDALTAYNQVAAEAFTTDLTGQDLGGLTLTPGVYFFSSSAQLTGTLTLDNTLDPNGVFHFQIGSTLTTASNSEVVLLGGSNDDIFWQVGSSATIGTGTDLLGSILALQSITFTTGATLLEGRALAINGAVTLDSNVINIPQAVIINAPQVTAVPEPGNWMTGLLLTTLLGTRNFGGFLRKNKSQS